MDAARSDALVFFGATGDLAFKQIFPALQALVKRGRLDMPIVAAGRRRLSDAEIRARAKKSIEENGSLDDSAFAALERQLRYVVVEDDDPGGFCRIRDALGAAKHPLHYVALPPELFEMVASNLAHAGLAVGARLALEKPFGHDGASARALSDALHASFDEDAIFRLDHYLAKEAVENLVYFRAANPLVESSLDRHHVESVQITMAENFGVEGRGRFYDRVGAVRDVVQSHMLEVVACLAMELPGGTDVSALREERRRLLASVRPLDPTRIVRGQVRGYLDDKDVAKGSTTETFAALSLTIDSERWQGVPFFLRVGKSLPVTATEAIVRWKQPRQAVLEDHAPPAPNHVRFRLGPDAVVALGANVKKEGKAFSGEPRELELHRAGADEMKPYERLLGDAIDGDMALFADRATAEELWRIVDPILGDATPVHPYEPGSWGPSEASRVAPDGGWYDPR